MDMDSLLADIYKEKAIQLGQFTLNNGQISSIYVDLRVLISSPKIMKRTAEALAESIKDNIGLAFDYVVGVPFGAIMLATLISVSLDKPMLLKRKEAKLHGNKRLIEGHYEANKRALIIEDVVTSGSSIMETVEELRKVGLVCDHVFCVLDREQGGEQRLRSEGITLHSLLKMTTILTFLIEQGQIDEEKKAAIMCQLNIPPYDTDQITKAETVLGPAVNENLDMLKESRNRSLSCKSFASNKSINWSLQSRLTMLKRSTGNKRMAEIMENKRSNLCLAVDLAKKDEIMEIINNVKESIFALKLHHDIIEDIDKEFIIRLRRLADEYSFLLLEDRKYADTGKTMEMQLTMGTYPVAEWADLVTVHALPGAPSLEALRPIIVSPKYKLCGLLLVSELSTKGSLTRLNNGEYVKQSANIADECGIDLISGFICQKRCHHDPRFLYWTPGVNLTQKEDGKGQQWRSPAEAIADGCDIVIVGRGICSFDKVTEVGREAERYAKMAWEALEQRAQ